MKERTCCFFGHKDTYHLDRTSPEEGKDFCSCLLPLHIFLSVRCKNLYATQHRGFYGSRLSSINKGELKNSVMLIPKP